MMADRAENLHPDLYMIISILTDLSTQLQIVCECIQSQSEVMGAFTETISEVAAIAKAREETQ